MYILSVAGTPELIVPTGEIPYHSIVTDRTEPLPIAVSLVGSPGTDIMLMKLATKVLERDGRPTKLTVGRSIFGDPNMTD